mgnify:CR=1 FL=1|jgi:2-methylisocitrate lyase-like PEP mutase family enzyme
MAKKTSSRCPLSCPLSTSSSFKKKKRNTTKGPAIYDGMTAKLVERAGGFSFAFSSGFSIAAARLGAPDTGLLSYEEVASSLRNAVEATSALPIIADGDTGKEKKKKKKKEEEEEEETEGETEAMNEA